MSTGILAIAALSLVLSQGPGDISYQNRRTLSVPITIPDARRGEIQELRLFASTDQGRNWLLAARNKPDNNAFTYYANTDGLHWLRVAVINRVGEQEPDDRTLMKSGLDKLPTIQMVIDTAKPIIRVINAQRQGDEVYLNWDIQEENPDRAGIVVQYQLKDSPASNWTTVSVPFALNGQARFRPAGNQPIVVRLSVRDLAGNQSYGVAEVSSTVTATNFIEQRSANTISVNSAQQNPFPEQTLPGTLHLSDPSSNQGKIPTSVIPPPPAIESSPYRAVASTRDVAQAGQLAPVSISSIQPPPAPPQVNLSPKADIVADSTRQPMRVEQLKTSAINKGGVVNDPPTNVTPVANATSMRKPPPPLAYVNNHEVSLEYELKRVGPSGIGGVELWLTRNEGATWEHYAEDGDVQHGTNGGKRKRTFEFREISNEAPFADGIYGLILVVKNRAGLGRKPRPGDVPEIRIEIDTQDPVAQLYKPIPDPQQPDHVLLMWTAKDKNLTETPINLEYAEKLDGPWLPIQLNLQNKGRHQAQDVSGDFSWKVPENIPVQVYLRLRVRDKAGNESIAVTPEPQFVDLLEPEGMLTGVQSVTKGR